MTLIEATKELHEICGGLYCAIYAECTVTNAQRTLPSDTKVTYEAYVHGHGRLGDQDSVEQVLAAARVKFQGAPAPALADIELDAVAS